MKAYNVEIVYSFEGQIFKNYLEKVTHAVIFRSAHREILEIESIVQNKINVLSYHSFISDDIKYDIIKHKDVVSVHFY